ncbi:hypothetical protein M885DRAFT_523006 [Pelagophyceae sp. CCMP2097]|nr:hypothetical protein M885DRAFT_523006 [Pelagophyceae sp. CCMP2097]
MRRVYKTPAPKTALRRRRKRQSRRGRGLKRIQPSRGFHRPGVRFHRASNGGFAGFGKGAVSKAKAVGTRDESRPGNGPAESQTASSRTEARLCVEMGRAPVLTARPDSGSTLPLFGFPEGSKGRMRRIPKWETAVPCANQKRASFERAVGERHFWQKPHRPKDQRES